MCVLPCICKCIFLFYLTLPVHGCCCVIVLCFVPRTCFLDFFFAISLDDISFMRVCICYFLYHVIYNHVHKCREMQYILFLYFWIMGMSCSFLLFLFFLKALCNFCEFLFVMFFRANF